MEKQVKVISLISDDFEDLELWYPILRCREAGVQVDVAGEAIREYTGKYGVHAQANFTFEEIPYEGYDGLLGAVLGRGAFRPAGDLYPRHQRRHAPCRGHMDQRTRGHRRQFDLRPVASGSSGLYARLSQGAAGLKEGKASSLFACR